MGTWGTAIFADDLADDVRDEFTRRIAEGLSSTAATKRLVAEYEEVLGDRWSDNTKSEISQRKKHLAKLRQQLAEDQPKPKKPRRRTKSSTQFKAGDVVAYQLTSRTTVRFCVLNRWGDLGGTYATICLLELDDGKPFRKTRLTLADTLAPHYTMVSREPDDRITILRRGVTLPDRVPKTFRAWNNLKISGHASTWDKFPDVLRKVLRKLGWKNSK